MTGSRTLHAALAIVTLCAYAVSAYPATTATIVDTAPSTSATMGARQSFWTRITYETDQPVSLWARPYRGGEEVREAMSNASQSYLGSGEALGWFALTEPGTVDEIRIIAGGGSPYRQWEVARRPVALRWTAAPASTADEPGWVADLRQVEQMRYQEDAARRAEEPVSAGDVAFFNGFMLTMLAILVAGMGVPLWAAWKWRGAWRWAAAVPVAIMAFVVLRIIVDTARDPTSHNLWPFEILQFGVLALAIIGGLKLLRRWTGAQV
ncbi:MAG: hypothetical protein AB7I04_05610 [Pseudomonadales bacterium]